MDPSQQSGMIKRPKENHRIWNKLKSSGQDESEVKVQLLIKEGKKWYEVVFKCTQDDC